MEIEFMNWKEKVLSDLAVQIVDAQGDKAIILMAVARCLNQMTSQVAKLKMPKDQLCSMLATLADVAAMESQLSET